MPYCLIALLLAGCSSALKHETVGLQCLGFCAYTNINHEKEKSNEATVPSALPAGRSDQ